MELLLIVSIWVLIAVLIDLAARDYLGLNLNGYATLEGPTTASSSNAVNITLDVKKEEHYAKNCCAQPPDPVSYPFGTKVDVMLLGKKFAVGRIVGFNANEITGHVEYVVNYKGCRAEIPAERILIHRTKKHINAEIEAITKRIKAHYRCD